jgi:hypothetical protein
MAMDPKTWLQMEQLMEEKNHILLQADLTETPQQPQLLMLSSHAAKGTSSVATFNLVISIGVKRGIALVDSGSTDTFMDYTFASRPSCHITATNSRAVTVVGGGTLDTCATITSIPYYI